MNALIGHNQRRQEELLSLVDRFVVLTQWARQAVVANGCPPERVELNRLGHSHHSLIAKPGPDLAPTRLPIRVGYVGRFDPLKGVRDLILAGLTLPGDREIQFELVGPLPLHANEPYYRHLRRLADRDSRFDFRPAVSPAHVPELLASYDVLVTPSLCTEGGPTVAIEAHANGTPVIGTPLGGLSELIEDTVNGRLFPPRDHRALAEILDGIIGDPASTIDYWRNNLPTARTMDDIVEDYLRLYENILAPPTDKAFQPKSKVLAQPSRPRLVRGDLTEHGKPQTAKDTQSCHPMSVSL
jgi:glycosyltransferase involved in cell wall biosynthesis